MNSSIQKNLYQFLMRSLPDAGIQSISGYSTAIATNIGNFRKQNQDRAILMKAQRTNEKSFLVGVLCDGMGGMKSGQESASLSISSFLESCIRNRGLDVESRLIQGVLDSNHAVHKLYDGGGGSTLVSFIIDSDGNSKGVSVGDSRIYSYDENGLKQLTKDDTINAQHLKNQLLQYVGIGESIEPHIIELPDLSTTSNIFLSSDGLHSIGDEIISKILKHDHFFETVTGKLNHISNWLGGHDNSTILMSSNFTSIFDSPIYVDPGTIQFWDPFGTGFLVGAELKNNEVFTNKQIKKLYEKHSEIKRKIPPIKNKRRQQLKRKNQLDMEFDD